MIHHADINDTDKLHGDGNMITKYTSLKIITTALVLFFCFQVALAVVPSTMNYQAYLTDDKGVPVDGTADVMISIYSTDVGGAALWSETRLGTTVNNGVLSVELGDTVPFPPGLFEMPLWIGVKVDADAEMTPRRPITSTGFAFKASDADTLDGISASSLDQSAHIGDTSNPHSVTAEQVGAASTADIATEISTHAGDASAHHTKTNSFVELSGVADDAQIPALIARDSEILSTVLAGDGSGSTLNADLFDGLDSSAFMSSAADSWVNTTGDTMTGPLILDVNAYQAFEIDSTQAFNYLRWSEAGSTRGYMGYSDGATYWFGSQEIPDTFAIKGITALQLGDNSVDPAITINNGNVGIGTNIPFYPLDVQGDSSEYRASFSSMTTGGIAYGFRAEANSYNTTDSNAFAGVFLSTAGSSGGDAHGVYSETQSYGASNAYGMFSHATAGTTTGKEYAFYGIGDSYISQDMDVNGTSYIGFERVVGSPVGLTNSTPSCSMMSTGTCYYASASSTCPTGKVLVGGGCSCSSAYNCGLIRNYPYSATNWFCSAVASTSSYTVTPYVNCARVAN
jgi:hypothetical protein